MADKKVGYHRMGYMVIESPSYKSDVANSDGKRSLEAVATTKTTHKNHGGGYSSKITESHKAGEFVDKRSGNEGFKEEVKYESSVKVNDKIRGCTTEYQTQVEHRKITTFTGVSSKGYGGSGSYSGGGYIGGPKEYGEKYVDYDSGNGCQSYGYDGNSDSDYDSDY